MIITYDIEKLQKLNIKEKVTEIKVLGKKQINEFSKKYKLLLCFFSFKVNICSF